MKRILASIVLTCAFCAATFAQVSVSLDQTGQYSYGVAETDQMVAMPIIQQPGFYYLQKNGYYLNTNLTAKVNVANLYDIFVKLNLRSRTGSPYQELQLLNASNQVNVISLDSAYGRIDATAALKLDIPVKVYFQLGKYSPAASNYQKISLYGTESSLGMLKLNSDLYAGLEVTKIFSTIEQMLDTSYSSLSLQAFSNADIDEAVQRLYDTDGSIGMHGEPVTGTEAYAPQILAALKLNGYSLPFGTLSAEAVYTLNGANIYAGNSFGAGACLSLELIPQNEDLVSLTLPISVGGAYYEKNTDVLAATTGTDSSPAAGADTTGFRDTIDVGVGVGIKYAAMYEMAAEFNLGGSYTSVKHIYRDPMYFYSASADGKFSYKDTFFVGGGLIFGTLGTVNWITKSGVTANLDDYHHAFTLAENLGWEAYVGINAGTKCAITLGVNENKGLAMNYGLESLRDGESKFRQKGSSNADQKFETFGVYLKTTLKM